ncbi:hypothetical protein F0D89_19730 [Escherichia coli]|nr:hypothetical protein [Escherichia coli]EFA4527274.1 hypothetical protein [Escherichia coli]EFC4537572.1 hypothetical protein [Escherichia coli]EFE6111154.1 hypothetical protein [Escherichia coli]EFO0353065.1 hypothetical protein [Escherichia coli]
MAQGTESLGCHFALSRNRPLYCQTHHFFHRLVCRKHLRFLIAWRIRGLTLSGTKTHVKQRFLPLTPLLMVSDVLWSPVLPA